MNTLPCFRSPSRASLALVIASALGLSACAHVDVRRINDDNRDKVEGFRFYLPRPYVSVKEPFPVAGHDRYVMGTLEGDRLVTLQSDLLSAELKGALGVEPGTELRVPVTIPSPTAQPKSLTQHGDDASGAGDPKVTLKAADDLLSDSAITPSILQAPVEGQPSKDTFSIKVVLASSAAYVAVRKVEVAIVPLAKGKADTSKIKKIPGTNEEKKFKKGSDAGIFVANGRRSDLPEGADFAVALLFEGQEKDGEDHKPVTLYATKLALHVDGAKAAPAAKSTSETTTAEGDKPKTEALLETSGDPTTSPLLDLHNKYFDIVYLPDFDEQYAVDVSAGLGRAGAKLGLENGWMVEKASVDVNNEQLGKLIFGTSQKLVDTGLDLLKGYLEPASLVAGATGGFAQQGEDRDQRKRVLVRLRFLDVALPGLYPVLKPSETRDDNRRRGAPSWIQVPYPPYTVVAYNVHRLVAVEVVNGGDGGGTPGPTCTLTSQDKDAIVAWAGKLKVTLDAKDPVTFDRRGLVLHTTTTLTEAEETAKRSELGAAVKELKLSDPRGCPVERVQLMKKEARK
jgi:hypothetical protein